MKIKLDENMPLRLAGILAKLGHQTDTVPEEGLSGRDDTEVWEVARKAERFLITHWSNRAKCLKQGEDFSVCFHVSGT